MQWADFRCLFISGIQQITKPLQQMHGKDLHAMTVPEKLLLSRCRVTGSRGRDNAHQAAAEKSQNAPAANPQSMSAQ
eukprot:1832089-Amphidinium_carterae.1